MLGLIDLLGNHTDKSGHVSGRHSYIDRESRHTVFKADQVAILLFKRILQKTLGTGDSMYITGVIK